MNRLLLALTVICFALAPVANSADEPMDAGSEKITAAKATPVCVKILWPVDLAKHANVKDRPATEAWISKNIEKKLKPNLMAVTSWVPLNEKRDEATNVWDGKVDDERYTCGVFADIIERKDGRIKVSLKGWGPAGGEITVTLVDEPGSREVVPVTEAKTEQGMPQVAILIGIQVK